MTHSITLCYSDLFRIVSILWIVEILWCVYFKIAISQSLPILQFGFSSYVSTATVVGSSFSSRFLFFFFLFYLDVILYSLLHFFLLSQHLVCRCDMIMEMGVFSYNRIYGERNHWHRAHTHRHTPNKRLTDRSVSMLKLNGMEWNGIDWMLVIRTTTNKYRKSNQWAERSIRNIALFITKALWVFSIYLIPFSVTFPAIFPLIFDGHLILKQKYFESTLSVMFLGPNVLGFWAKMKRLSHKHTQHLIRATIFV